MKNLISCITLILCISFTSLAQAQIGSAPLREGKSIQADFELVDTSMAWLAVDFENVSHPSFQLNDLSVSFETIGGKPLRDFYHFSPYKRNEQGRSHYLVGLSLPLGSYKITNISGRGGNILFGGNMTFDFEIPLRVSAVGKHYYLGNISIQNISTEDNRLQRSGDRTPLLSQAISGFGNGTLNLALTDSTNNDVSLIKSLFPTVSSLQSATIEKKLITFIKIPYSLGQGLEPLALRMQSPSQPELAINKDLVNKKNLDIETAHALPIPPISNFAPNLNVEYLPQKMTVGLENIYKSYPAMKGTKALAISGYGIFGIGVGTNAIKTALDNCSKYGRPCQLYAVDNNVVWDADSQLAKIAKQDFATVKAAESLLKPTGFANVDDFTAVPNLGVKGKELYVEWLSKSNPKAVAISDRGAIARGYGESSVSTAIANCERFGRKCKIYAFNGDVVFEPFPTTHDTPIPAETGYAKLVDTLAPPYGTRGSISLYENWLSKGNPKAIALSNSGVLSYATGVDSMATALENCNKAASTTAVESISKEATSNNTCKLYAVDSVVVFTAFNASHRSPPPPATSFAIINDIAAVPKLSKNGKDAYQFWLTRGKPKAFALSNTGTFAYKIGADSQVEAINSCEKTGQKCKLYAVDDAVVWDSK